LIHSCLLWFASFGNHASNDIGTEAPRYCQSGGSRVNVYAYNGREIQKAVLIYPSSPSWFRRIAIPFHVWPHC
jgi:hypothetical protein